MAPDGITDEVSALGMLADASPCHALGRKAKRNVLCNKKKLIADLVEETCHIMQPSRIAALVASIEDLPRLGDLVIDIARQRHAIDKPLIEQILRADYHIHRPTTPAGGQEE